MSVSTDSRIKVVIACDTEALALRGLRFFVDDAAKAIKAKDIFYVAISGGSTPRRFFELLGSNPESRNLPWEKIQLFWVDERYVPTDSQWSNYKLAADTFLSKIDIPVENVHRIPTEYDDFNVAAKSYEQGIQAVFGLEPGQCPRFDLVILGMSDEGHVGSLFPNSYAPFDKDDLACVVYSMDDTQNRITLTHPVLKAAAHLTVIVSGKSKAEILKKVLTSDPDDVQYPIHALWPVLDRITFLVDIAASKLL